MGGRSGPLLAGPGPERRTDTQLSQTGPIVTAEREDDEGAADDLRLPGERQPLDEMGRPLSWARRLEQLRRGTGPGGAGVALGRAAGQHFDRPAHAAGASPLYPGQPAAARHARAQPGAGWRHRAGLAGAGWGRARAREGGP